MTRCPVGPSLTLTVVCRPSSFHNTRSPAGCRCVSAMAKGSGISTAARIQIPIPIATGRTAVLRTNQRRQQNQRAPGRHLQAGDCQQTGTTAEQRKQQKASEDRADNRPCHVDGVERADARAPPGRPLHRGPDADADRKRRSHQERGRHDRRARSPESCLSCATRPDRSRPVHTSRRRLRCRLPSEASPGWRANAGCVASAARPRRFRQRCRPTPRPASS